ncbi:hypothetical protein SH661x_001190 [Planctomicrobium sp. SH661]|uniref:hypothetical protein n=1 Tax=Planctomicrobium sp. SH661 TaxID=3448124 RepID=UPI003F5BB77E
MLVLLTSVQSGELTLLGSEALEYEIGRIPDDQRRAGVLSILGLADERLEVSSQVEALAVSLEQKGISPMDALQLALASDSAADYFGTCDDRLLQRVAGISNLNCRSISILQLVEEVLK